MQRKVIELILNSRLTDKERESSKVFELKHSSGCTQVGRILAEKRGLSKEYAELICVLHDIYVIVKGKYKNHAHLGAPIAEKILRGTKKFTEKEIKLISEAIYCHSEKHVYTDNPYVELAKDADTLDCFLYDNVEDYYIYNKSPKVAIEYFKRINKLRKEMGMRSVKEYMKIIKDLEKKAKMSSSIPFNQKAKWKKLFSREYAVQYTEASLRSLSPEVKDILPFTFFEQIYVPENSNQVCYVDEANWNKFLKSMYKAWGPKDFRKFRNVFMKTGNQYVSYCKKVSKMNIKSLTNQQLVRLYREYQKRVIHYTSFIWTTFFLNEFYSEKAKEIIHSKLKENEDPHQYYEAVFTPNKRAAILELTHRVSTGNLTKESIKQLYARFKWIPCLDIHNPAWTFGDFKKHLSEFKRKKQDKGMPYDSMVKNLKISSKDRNILEISKEFSYIKDLRDDFRREGIFYIISSLFEEIAKRLKLSLQEISYFKEQEIIDALVSNSKIDKSLISQRKKGFVIYYNNNKEVQCISGEGIQQSMSNLGLVSLKVNAQNIKGTPASNGEAVGRVVIVKGVKDLPKVNQGDILVAVTTHPDYVPAMQKAIAIVTDEGGVTSHAAIVSREFDVPCVVGTKVATHLLKSGNVIKVDGTHGTVKILK